MTTNSQMFINKISSLCKRRGFIFPSSQIYGGWEAAYDFGPLGAEMLRNVRNLWWREFVHKKPNVVGLDGAIISHPRVWEASGHTELFADVMLEDIVTHDRYRADHLINEVLNLDVDGFKPEEIDKIVLENSLKSPAGNPLSKAKYFNQLVEVKVGTLEDSKSLAYLRGETCQPIFYNYELIKDSMRLKLPFGIAQIGKAFRNEIKVGPFIYRTREFEQMELEMYLSPDDANETFAKFKKESLEWLQSLGVASQKLRFREQQQKERAHYNKVAYDLEYEFSYGWKEIQGIHYRTDWDLRRHGEYSQKDFTYTDELKNQKYIPHVVEYSIGLNRLIYVLLSEAYCEEDSRIVLKLDKRIAPYRAAVFPLLRNKEELVSKAKEVYQDLIFDGDFNISWDDRGNIGKRYLYQDEIGTPYCITIDFQTLQDNTVTIRNRDTTNQDRLNISDLKSYLK